MLDRGRGGDVGHWIDRHGSWKLEDGLLAEKPHYGRSLEESLVPLRPPLVCEPGTVAARSTGARPGHVAWCMKPDGTPHGRQVRWSAEWRRLAEGNVVDGERVGRWTYYDASGRISAVVDGDGGARRVTRIRPTPP